MRAPVRRNKRFGLAKGGRVKDGRAEEKWSRVLTRNTWHDICWDTRPGSCRVYLENPSGEFYHPCDGDEYLSVLRRLPKKLSRYVGAIILRRPPKLDVRLGIDARLRGSCVILNAFPRSNEMIWYRSPTAGAKRHYERWCSNWTKNGNVTKLRWSNEEIRHYYLYHLFLHEVGHVNQPAIFHKSRRREEFAENFALEWAERLKELPPKPNK